MSIELVIIESAKQIVANIPEYISISVKNVTNVIVYYTLDGTTPDQTGASLTTFIMEHAAGDPLNGVIFLRVKENILDLNILAIGPLSSDIATFYRRYGLESRNIGIGRPGIKKPIIGGSAYTNTVSPNIAVDGSIIAGDGYTTGKAIKYDLTGPNVDGYDDGYYLSVSGIQTAIPTPLYDHIDGYTDGTNAGGYSTTTLTPAQELELVKLSNSGNIFVAIPDTNIATGSRLVSNNNLSNIDPRSSTVIDSNDDKIEVVPIEDYPVEGYTIDGYSIDDNWDNAPQQQTTVFTSSGIFDPRASYIEIDGRIDGYINGQPIVPGDRVIINKPYGELRYSTKKEDLGDAIRTTMGYISGGLVCPIYDYNRGQAAFYYWDSHDNRWILSLQKIEAPKYEIFARRNGVVVGAVFKWINGKRQMLPG